MAITNIKCIYCGNNINNNSLQFYMNKYKEELINKQKQDIENMINQSYTRTSSTKQNNNLSNPINQITKDNNSEVTPKLVNNNAFSLSDNNYPEVPKKKTKRKKIIKQANTDHDPLNVQPEILSNDQFTNDHWNDWNQKQKEVVKNDKKYNKLVISDNNSEIPLSELFKRKKSHLISKINQRNNQQNLEINKTDPNIPKDDIHPTLKKNKSKLELTSNKQNLMDRLIKGQKANVTIYLILS